MKQQFPVSKLHGHDLQVQPFADGTARITVDGAFVSEKAFCEIVGVPEETYNLFFRRYARGTGEPIAFENPTQAAICMICLTGYTHALERERKSA